MNRTRIVLLGVLLVFLLGVAFSPAGAQRPPIKIGFMTDLTGTAAQAAKDMVNGLTPEDAGGRYAGSLDHVICPQ